MISKGAVLLLGLGSGVYAQRIPTSPACSPPALAPDRAVTIDAGSFAVRLPVGDTALRLPSVDSQVGGWAGEGHRITYDYGSYSNPLDSLPELADVQRCRALIEGHSVLVVTARDSANRLVVAAHWPGLEASSLGPVSLTMFGTATDSGRRLDLLRVVWSVRFKH